MTAFDRTYPGSVRVGRAALAVDAGLRAFMLGVYKKLAFGLVPSAAVAWLTSTYRPAAVRRAVAR